MAKKINDLQRDYDAYIAREEELNARKAAAEAEVETLRKEAEDAAAAGDVDAYRTKKAALADREEILYVLQRRSVHNPIMQEDADAAWETRSKDHRSNMKRHQKELDKIIDEAERAFTAMLREQSDTLRDRERLAVYAGITPEEAEKRFTMEFIPEAATNTPNWYKGISPVLCLLIESGRWPLTTGEAPGMAGAMPQNAKAAAANDIIKKHKPAKI